MSFDGVLLNKLKNEFNILKTGRISKISESGDTDFLFTIRANRRNHQLMLSFSSDFARIHLTNRSYEAPRNPRAFTMLLRKHIEGYFIEDINTYHNDRIIYFTLSGYNEMQDLSRKYLICEVMGRYSNMILTDDSFKIIEALKHDGVGEYNRTILPNATYTFPETNKLNPMELSKDQMISVFEERKPQSPKDVMNIFNGVSLNLAYPIFMCDKHAERLYDYINSDIRPCTFISFKGKEDFYYNPFDNKPIKEYDTISEMLDDFYYNLDLRAKVRLKTNDLESFVNRQITKYKKKIEKLNEELRNNDKNDIYRLYGELLLSYPNLKEKAKRVEVLNYYDNTNVSIDLDNKYTVLENSNRYYKKYQKAKNSISHINEQIAIAKDEVDYFTLLNYQLSDCTINEALEIQDELINNKYLFKPITNKKKNQKPKLLTYIVDDTLISVGKNNLQNEYLTHKLAKGNELWFHIKDGAGSHVVVHDTLDPSEEVIRAAASLAAFYSSYKESSSVAVDYTRVRNIKKIPARRACFVTYTHQKTIYIDPSEDYIRTLEVKK